MMTQLGQGGVSSPRPGIKIKVVCRVRPFLKGEEQDNSVQVNHAERSLVVVNQRNSSEVLKYSFDNCYDSQATQEEIFTENLVPLLQEVCRGLDATVFCYGMTGAGKTHTIQGTPDHPGLIPQSMKAIFQRQKEFLAKATPGTSNKFDIQVSYMEIYKETVFDLFKPRDPGMKEGLMVREDAKRNVFVAGLEKKKIISLEQFELEFTKACKNRATAATRLNQQSSRSHAILGVDIKIEDGTTNKVFKGKLNLIDLAGSEDNRRTGNDAMRLDESKAINTSLLVLGKVVDAINSRASRIPYRDSKMTRILQSSLGGKSLGMMFVNIAPAKKFFLETYQALNFATKSKEIVNNAVANETKEIPRVRSINLQSLTSKRPSTLSRPSSRLGFSRPPSRTGMEPKTEAGDANYRELASRLNSNTKKSNANALIRYANKKLEEGNIKEGLVSLRQAQEFSPDDPELQATILRLETKIKSPSKKAQTANSPASQGEAKVLASSMLSPPRGLKRPFSNTSALPSLSSPEPDDSPMKLFNGLTPRPSRTASSTDVSAETSKTDSLNSSTPSISTCRSLRSRSRQAKTPSQITAVTSDSSMTEEQKANSALSDRSHPLLALFQMGKPDILKGIWPSGVKTRNSVAEFVQTNGLSVLGDLIPDAVSKKVLLKAIRKFNAQ
ncbi:hypothetical protein DSO57_1018947 [Entomophthora muscae]|uniref:Uncharacterized protein n=1 Tax=Entomophthora muscae TaxID=34485 RepID=A0ACC2U2H3_9FUNG|nr:hypothetical protein DSO57_1018947 [Entomophthora muscae]